MKWCCNIVARVNSCGRGSPLVIYSTTPPIHILCHLKSNRLGLGVREKEESKILPYFLTCPTAKKKITLNWRSHF